jgi:hypothetical protein
MEKVKLKSLGYLDLILLPECRALLSEWSGGALNRDIKAGLEMALAEYKKCEPGTQWIGETTHIGIIGDEDQAWINNDWVPRFMATGVKYMAVIQPASIIAKLNVKNILQTYEGTNLTVFNCGTLEEAAGWMKTVNKE